MGFKQDLIDAKVKAAKVVEEKKKAATIAQAAKIVEEKKKAELIANKKRAELAIKEKKEQKEKIEEENKSRQRKKSKNPQATGRVWASIEQGKHNDRRRLGPKTESAPKRI